jgi:hypothetical protein
MTLEEALEAISKKDASIVRLEGKNEELIGKLKTANDRADTAEKEAAKVTAAEERATTAEAKLVDYRAENALNAALLANNVDPKHIPLLLKATKNDIKPDADGEPTINGKTIESWGKDFFSKDGLSYVRAADNNGGGATGNTSTATSKTTLTKRPSTPAEWDELDALSDEDRNAFCDRINAPDLKV